MRGIKYGFSFFCNNIKANLLIALEIAMLLVTANSLLGFYNNLSILYVPYEDILKNEGVLYFDNSYAFDPEKAIDKAELFENLNKLEGDVLSYYSYTIPLYDESKSAQVIHIIDDRIYDKLVYPLSSGSFEPGCAVASSLSGYKTGDTISTEFGEVKVSGVLTTNTYFPVINGCEDVDGLHGAFTSDIDETEFVILDISSAKKLYTDLPPSFLNDTVMISFENCTDEQTRHNYDHLRQKGQVWEFEKINTRTVTKLKEQYARFVPFIYIISIAVIIGIISFSIVTSLDNKADMDILYNCGAGSMDLFFVMLGKNLCIIISAVTVSAFSLTAMKLTGILNSSGIMLKPNLIPCSLLIITSCIVMCQLVSTLSNLTFWRKVK